MKGVINPTCLTCFAGAVWLKDMDNINHSFLFSSFPFFYFTQGVLPLGRLMNADGDLLPFWRGWAYFRLYEGWLHHDRQQWAAAVVGNRKPQYKCEDGCCRADRIQGAKHLPVTLGSIPLSSSTYTALVHRGAWFLETTLPTAFRLGLAKGRNCQNFGRWCWEEAWGASRGASDQGFTSSDVLDPVTKSLPPSCFCLVPAHMCRLSLPAFYNTMCSLCSPAQKW